MKGEVKDWKTDKRCKVDWTKVRKLWAKLSDREIAERVGCSIPTVFLRRRKLIGEAKNAAERALYTRTVASVTPKATPKAKAKAPKAKAPKAKAKAPKAKAKA